MSQNVEDLKHIRSMMEKSTKFLSLSGLSGVLAGSFALVGVFIAHMVLHKGWSISSNIVVDLFLIAGFVLLGAASSGIYFSIKKAHKNHSKFWTKPTIGLMIDAGIPMIIGGIFCLILLYHGVTYLLPATMLIFCGIALINGGDRTYRDVKILGSSLVIVGIFAGFFTDYGLLFLALGFGVLFIIYGVVMYYRYDMKSSNK